METHRGEGARRLVGEALVLLLAVLIMATIASPARAAGDANTMACPNESLIGFSESLPDCRAYEMVSPPFKAGYRVAATGLTADGSSVLLESLGAFSGVESDFAGATYEAQRTAAGWAVSAENLPASLFRVSTRFSQSSDLGQTLWAAHRSTQAFEAVDLYVREQDGAIVPVGPMAPPAAEVGPPTGASEEVDLSHHSYAGASDDLSHVLFEIFGEALRWPGDTTVSEGGAASLYEYAGRENHQPSLVGVSSEGDVISDCRTTLGDHEEGNDTYNAVSASGETVFFTAVGHQPEGQGCGESTPAPAANELYARVDGSQTVPISEPSAAQCSECNTAAPAPALFQGASEDGSKAFFLTEQELLPGATTNNLYEYDFDAPAGHRIVRVSIGSPTPEVLGVARVSEDGSHVYFVARGVLTSEPDHSLAPGRQVAQAGADNLYLYEQDSAHPTGHLAFLATLSEADSSDWSHNDVRPVQTTPEGRFLVFDSAADLTAGDTSSEPQVFEYDAREATLVRVSIGQAGYAAGAGDADTYAASIPVQDYETAKPTTADTNLAVSEDGSLVVFSSVAALSPQAEPAQAAGAESVYEYRSAGTIGDGDVYLISAGDNMLGAEALGTDPSGADVFFETAVPLLGQDGDTQYDLYDARIDGGVSAPPSSPVCEGEACHAASPASPSFATPASISLPDAGNLEPARTESISPAALAKAAKTPLQRALARCRKLRKHTARSICETKARHRYRRPRRVRKAKR